MSSNPIEAIAVSLSKKPYQQYLALVGFMNGIKTDVHMQSYVFHIRTKLISIN